MQKLKILYAMLLLIVIACTPKVVEETAKEPVTEPEETIVDENLSPCKKFSDSGNELLAREKYVLYRDEMKMKNYPEAYKLWQEVYEMAPAADGRRNTVYADGIKIYQYFLKEEKDEAKQGEYVDKIFALYDEVAECYEGDKGYVKARKAFDLYYRYPERASEQEKYQMFKEAIAIDGMKTRDFVVNPFTDLMIRLFLKDEIPMTEAQENARFIMDRIEQGTKDCKGTGCERWAIIKDYAPLRLEELEGVKGFYDCAYFQEKYYPMYQEEQDDCDVIDVTLGRFLWGGCPTNDAKVVGLSAAKRSKCGKEEEEEEEEIKTSSTAVLAYRALKSGDFATAARLYPQAAAESTDNMKKARYLFTASKINYAHLKKYSTSRSLAREALEYRSNWGEPYILIGKLYASSGPLCGPGRGFDSQRVVWAAIDKWNQAKSVDPSVAGEANKLINRYNAFMPNNEDVFMKNLKIGQSYTVPCWIQEKTKVRAVK